MRFEVHIFNNQAREIRTDGLPELVRTVWRSEGKVAGEIRVILVDDQELLELNKKHLHSDDETDVIAFPLSDGADDAFEGEIYVSVDRIIENAVRFEVAPYRELQRVVVHGILHFVGYTDKQSRDKEKMVAREDYYLRQFGLN